MKQLRVLVACEYSGTVRDAFIAKGHDAMSCDLLPTDVPGPHYQGDVRDVIHGCWDLMIAHPPLHTPCCFRCKTLRHEETGRAATVGNQLFYDAGKGRYTADSC